VNYYCSSGYSPKIAQPSECKNGVIDVLKIECYQDCPAPPDDLVNGDAPMLNESNAWNQTAEYQCQSGFELFPDSLNTRICDGDGKWKGLLGKCHECVLPISDVDLNRLNIEPKYLDGEKVDEPLTIEYVCKEEYTLLYEGNFVYTCQNDGSWNNTNVPQCVNDCYDFQKSENLLNYEGALSFCKNEFGGTLLQHTLMLKWKTHHGTITTVRDNERVYTGINDTNAEGVYEFLDGTKASIKEIPENEEDLFIVFAAGQPTDDTNEDHLEINENGNFNQVAGTTTLKAMCEKEKAHCRDFRCPQIDNATMTIEVGYLGEEYVRGVEITYECNPGFNSTFASNELKCNSEGWSEDVKCLKTCPELNAPDDGKVTFLHNNKHRSNVRLPGEVMEIACNEDFFFYDKEADYTYECLEGGSWNNSKEAICMKECPEPPNANEYDVEYKYSFENGEYWLNTTVTYESCNDDDYLLYPEDITSERNVLTCQRTGTWEPETAPNCGLNCKYEIADCYSTAPGSRNCDSSGVGIIDGSILRRQDISYHPDVYDENVDWTTITRTRKLYCIEGRFFEDVNNRVYTCEQGEPWSPYPLPRCLTACPKDINEIDSNVASGFTFPNINSRDENYVVGTVVTYTCDSGYEPSNDGEATCTWNGMWDPPVECNDLSNAGGADGEGEDDEVAAAGEGGGEDGGSGTGESGSAGEEGDR